VFPVHTLQQKDFVNHGQKILLFAPKATSLLLGVVDPGKSAPPGAGHPDPNQIGLLFSDFTIHLLPYGRIM
jgi:hypothetical protein